MEALRTLDPATIAQHAGAVVARLEDPDENFRLRALDTLSKLDLLPLAQHVDAVVRRLEDTDQLVRVQAVRLLGTLEPATLAQHADALVRRLEDTDGDVRRVALYTMEKLDPATITPHASAVIAMFEDSDLDVRMTAFDTLRALPHFITRYILPERVRWNTSLFHGKCGLLRARLLGRLGWYRCRLRLRVRRLALYWYALPYRPNGPGHARDVEAWDRMIEE